MSNEIDLWDYTKVMGHDPVTVLGVSVVDYEPDDANKVDGTPPKKAKWKRKGDKKTLIYCQSTEKASAANNAMSQQAERGENQIVFVTNSQLIQNFLKDRFCPFQMFIYGTTIEDNLRVVPMVFAGDDLTKPAINTCGKPDPVKNIVHLAMGKTYPVKYFWNCDKCCYLLIHNEFYYANHTFMYKLNTILKKDNRDIDDIKSISIQYDILQFGQEKCIIYPVDIQY